MWTCCCSCKHDSPAIRIIWLKAFSLSLRDDLTRCSATCSSATKTLVQIFSSWGEHASCWFHILDASDELLPRIIYDTEGNVSRMRLSHRVTVWTFLFTISDASHQHWISRENVAMQVVSRDACGAAAVVTLFLVDGKFDIVFIQ